MLRRPQLAAKVAQCISQWAEIEIFLGGFLGLLLHTNQRAAVAMYSGLENRSAQLRLITSAAKASVPPSHFEVLSVFMTALIRPTMKERDKLAHWIWGYSDDLPDALLISDPSAVLDNLMQALTLQPGVEGANIPSNFDTVYVIRDGDLDGVSARSAHAKDTLRLAMSTIWDHNTSAERAEYLRQLSNAPQVREGLKRRAQPGDGGHKPPFG